MLQLGVEGEKILVYHACRTRSQIESPTKIDRNGGHALRFTGMMVKPQIAIWMIRQVAEDIVLSEIYPALLDIPDPYHFHRIDQPRRLEQRCTYNSIQITSNDGAHLSSSLSIMPDFVPCPFACLSCLPRIFSFLCRFPSRNVKLI
ncbi:hypothetical protein ES705_50532 [subsurface metagenome]